MLVVNQLVGFNATQGGGGAWDLTNAAYTGRSFSTTSQTTTTTGIAMSPDGTKLFVIGNSADSVYEYTLSVANKIDTASYASRSFDFSGQETNATGIAFNTSGTRMYILGIDNDTVYEYELSTPFQVDTASYSTRSFGVTTQEPVPTALAFNADGTRMYVVGHSSRAVFEYTLSTGFQVNTASYSSRSFSISSQENTPYGLFFGASGTKMFVSGNTSDAVYQYSLGTAYQVDTASYDSVSFSVAGQDGAPIGMAWSADGTKFFIAGNANDAIFEYAT